MLLLAPLPISDIVSIHILGKKSSDQITIKGHIVLAKCLVKRIKKSFLEGAGHIF